MKIVIQEFYKKFNIFIEEKSLGSVVFIGISKFIALVFVFILVVWLLFFLLRLVLWGGDVYSRWEDKNRNEETFYELAKAAEYDTKIVAMREFTLYQMSNLGEGFEKNSDIPSDLVKAIFNFEGKKTVFLIPLMPKFFADVEFSANNRFPVEEILCVQGRVRKKYPDLSFGKPEDKFFVSYKNKIREESEQMINKSLEIKSDKGEKILKNKKRESIVMIKSNSALYDGNCLDAFQGWIKKEID
jgi:hypothetical protein